MPDNMDETESLFPLTGNIERPLIEEIVKAVRNLFRREDVTAIQMHHLAVLLFGLEHLPVATPGINVTLILAYRTGENMNHQSVDLDENTFSLLSGGSVYDPNGGHDSSSDEVLMVEATGYRDAKEMAMVEWLMGFKERIVDADIRVDLDEACDPAAKQRAESADRVPDRDDFIVRSNNANQCRRHGELRLVQGTRIQARPPRVAEG
jgi:hypothetical protein